MDINITTHTQRFANGNSTLVDLLRWRAAQQPERVAYTFLANGEDEEISFTYAELDRQARAIGGLLQSTIEPGERALLLYPSGLQFIAAFFGCLYGGAIAVPVYPPDPARYELTFPRFRAIAGDARPRVALTTSGIYSRFKESIVQDPLFSSMRWIVTDEIEAEHAGAWRAPKIDSDMLAFLQYTSGSTSIPKGVMVSHGNLLYNEQTIQDACGHTHESTFAGWLPLYHDMGLIGNVLQPLYIGARCVLMSPVAFLQRPLRWLDAISRFKAATSGGPNFAYDLCVRKTTPEQRASLDLSSWTTAFNGAEPVRLESLERFAKAFEVAGFRREAFYPCYGLAEGTLIVSGATKHRAPVTCAVNAASLEQNRFEAATDDSSRVLVACGQVLGGQKLAIVEPESMRPCAPGQIGEIWLSGPSVAHGYWQQPEQTEKTFRAYLAGTSDGPFLRTGDLGYYDGDELFITGRLKDLIIIRGRNHYPQDIEASVERCHPALRPGCGAAFSVEADGEELLVIVHEVEYREQPDLQQVIDRIRQAVSERHELQAYAVVIIKSGRIPKTSSGKIQRYACRAKFLEGTLEVLSESRASSAPEEAAIEIATPRSAEEIRAWLTAQLAAKLGIQRNQLDPDKPLVHYGLDSIAIIEQVHNIETVLGVSLPMVMLLQDSSINRLSAEILAQLNAETSQQSIESPRVEAGEYELSYGQKALWFLQQMNPGPQGHIAAAVKVHAELDVAALRRAFQELVDRHAALRTSFVSRQGEPFQIVADRVSFDPEYHDAAEWSETELQARLADEVNRPFDLAQAPLLRVSLFKRSERCHVLLLVINHIVSDFWSLSVLLNELGHLYAAAKSSTPPALAPLKLTYTDYVRRQQSMLNTTGDAQWRYWQEKLSGELSTLGLLTDRPRPPVQTYRGASQSFKLDAETTAALKSLSQTQGVTLYVTLLAAFQTLLFRYTHQKDILVGSPTVGRSSADLAGLVGYFVNPVVIRTDLAGNPSFTDLIRRVRETVLQAFAHQDYPFALLVERLQPVRDPGFSPLFQTMFALQKAHLLNDEGLSPFALGESGRRMRVGDLELESFALNERTTQFDLTLLMAEADHEIFASFEYNRDLFDAMTIARLSEHFQTLVHGIITNPQQQLLGLPLLTEEEQQQLISGWNNTRVNQPADMFVQHLVEQQAELRPELTAVVCAGEQINYRELNARANQLAHRLRSLGVGPESVVGIMMQRSIDFVIGVLGILKAGGAYLPLDPDYPCERLTAMLENAGATALLTEKKYAGTISEPDVPVIQLDADWDLIAQESEANPAIRLTGKNAAYVIYTSGSTGSAKGVVISHESLANLVCWHQHEYNVTHPDRATLLAGISFDASVWELWPYLTTGASIHLPDDETRSSPEQLRDWLVAHQISIGFVPTPVAESMLALDWSGHASLRAMLTGGDALRRYPSPAIGFELVNHYGPTESTVVASSCRLAALESATTAPPIGAPIDNTRIYLLDARLQVVPVGVAAEMYIGGLGLARGYMNDPAQTAERFIPDPFSDEPGLRLYRTGDLARYLPDGKLEFLGRTDHQVKIRGFRVELGEIEVTLRRHVKLADAVVMAQRNGHDENQLVAYLVTNGQTVKNGELRQFLKVRLPHYMLPAVFVQLERMPLTPNGKIDRKALPLVNPAVDAEFSAPRTPIEDVLATIWTGVLDLAQVGIHDNFFERGGHSLLATQIISRVVDYFDVKVPLHSLFENPTIAGMAQCVEDALRDRLAVKSPPLVPVSRSAALPVSFAQERLWFIDQLDRGNPAYNCPAAVSLVGPLDVEALRNSFNHLVERHESLRTTFVAIDGLPYQIISDAAPLYIPLLDLEQYDPELQAQEVARLAAAEAQRRFDLQTGPLLRVTLLRLGGQQHVLLLTLHHIISDAWSIGVLVREIAGLYESFREGREPGLTELAIQYGDFAVWQREWLQGAELEQQVRYWREQLAGIRGVLELPQAKPRPAQSSHQGAAVELKLDEDLSRGLRELSREHGVTLYMLLLAAFKVLLYRYSGAPEIVVGTGIANRNRVETEGLIGFFVNMLVLRTRLESDWNFAEVLQRVKDVCIGAYAHQDVPFEKLVEELQPDRSLSHPLFQVMMLLQNAPISEFHLEGLKLEWSVVPTSAAKFDLTLDLEEKDGVIGGRLEYNTDLFDEPIVERMVDHFTHLLEQVTQNSATRVSDLVLLREAEATQILSEWNDTVAPRTDECIHERFEKQVDQTPDAVALIFNDETWTYGELDSRANRLANYVRRHGVGPELRVGICLQRSVNAVVSMLAILKAGGAYVPLDPNYPAERLDFVRRDAELSLLLTEARFANSVTAGDTEVILLDREWPQIAAESDEAPATNVSAENVAYVIYTSGSTGRPKGVMALHRGAMNRFRWMWRTYPFGANEICCQKTSLGFVDSVWEIFGPLLQGVPSLIIPDDVAKDPRELNSFLAQQHVTRIVLVPSLLRAMLDNLCGLKNPLPDLGVWVSSGEALPLDLYERFREHLPDRVLLNLYGSSEASADSTYFEVSDRNVTRNILIGSPIDNTQIYLLDEQLRPGPIGVPAELYIGGDGLARGYLAQPALTAEKFIPNPFSAKAAERLYRTGDLARWTAEGKLEYVGRSDHQVKIRGIRVELGEVEDVLNRHTDVKQAVITALEDTPGEKRLIAYVVPAGDPAPGVSEMRNFMRKVLPEYMVPAAFVFLETLPVTSSGKINRLALPPPRDAGPELAEVYKPPRTPVEQELAALWSELLRTEHIGIDDNFFDLGGHSLMATQLLSRVRLHFHVEPVLQDFFKSPTIAEMAQLIEAEFIAKSNTGNLDEMLDLLDALDDQDLPATLVLDESPGASL